MYNFYDIPANLLYLFSFFFIAFHFFEIRFIMNRRQLCLAAVLLLAVAIGAPAIGNPFVILLCQILIFTLLQLVFAGETLPEALRYGLIIEILLEFLSLLPRGILIVAVGWQGVGRQELDNLIYSGCSLLLLIVLWLRYRSVQYVNLKQALLKKGKMAGALLLLDVVIMNILFFLTENASTEGNGYFFRMTALIVVAGIYFQLFIFFELVIAREALEQQGKWLEHCLKQQEENYRYQDERNRRTRQFRHDIRNHLIILQELAERGEQEKVREYLDSLNGVLESFGHYKTMNHGYAEIIVNQYLQEAARRGILFRVSGQFPEHCRVADTDMVAILSNLLSNAFEAEEKYGGTISLQVRYNSDEIMIETENSCDPELKLLGQELRTGKKNKEEHGIGLLSVRDCVGRNGGDLLLQAEKGRFRVLLSLKNEDKE